MPLTLLTVPCLSDNYAFLLHDEGSGDTALVDAPEAAPIREALDARGWRLTDILLTHHHPDHVQGVEDLRKVFQPRVIGARADQHRLPALDLAVGPENTETVCGETVRIFDVPGHTVGHIAFYLPGSGLLFSGDSLMALGCGRLFEGSPDQMWQSLLALRDLPGDTTVCSGHEYTEGNARFALTVDPRNEALISRAEAVREARAENRPTVPSTLSEERDTNPFLRADDPAVAAAVDMAGAAPVEVFAEIRARKDRF